MVWFKYPEFPNKTFHQLDGAEGPATYQDSVKLDEPGDWTVKAILVQSDGKQAQAWMSVTVVGLE